MLSHTDHLGIPCRRVASLYEGYGNTEFAFVLAYEVLATPI